MIHAVDPNHPVTTVLAGAAPREVAFVKAKCPALDLLAINTYAGLATLPQQIRTANWQGSYLVAEWGPTGHWESQQMLPRLIGISFPFHQHRLGNERLCGIPCVFVVR